ncbi:MAG: HAD hydrolase-like protein [Terracidiphilus sp.]|jgi:phosphoglycolate phosphatase-like HAD superfamily hydrolase
MENPTQTAEARVHVEPGFAWDAQDAYLFDIDGTLLRDLDRIHMNSFASSIQRVTGIEVSMEGVPVHGSTDTAILRAACRQAGIPVEVLEPQVKAILDAMCQRVNEQRGRLRQGMVLMPGVKEFLGYLAKRGALLGVATGNLEAIGWIKLEEAGLRQWFRFGGFSDHYPIRGELIGNAAQKAREMAGADARICVVGDTPRDVEAARANQLPVIAVATGNFNFETLLELRPEVCASSLADLLAMKGTAE